MPVKLINHDGKIMLPIPADIYPPQKVYNVFQTEDGVLLCIPYATGE